MKFIRKLAALRRREKLDADMTEEMRLHLETRTRENIAAGMSPAEARYAALRKFGGVEQAKERCRDEHRRGVLWLDHLVRDVRVGFRVLLKEKSFFAISVVILALGIGGVTAQFSVLHSTFFRGLPFAEPDQLVSIAVRDPSSPPGRSRPLFARDLLNWSQEQRSFAGLAGYFSKGSFIVTIGELPQRFAGSHVVGPLFAVLGVKPALGRDFTEADDHAEAPRVTIISDALWTSEFGRDPAILGRGVRLNGKAATVIGVMPPGFNFPGDQLWMPMLNEYPRSDDPGWTGGTQAVLGRLKRGVSIDAATAELALLAKRTAADYPKSNRDLTEVVVQPLLNTFVGSEARQMLMAMLAAVVTLLVIACVNVMNMQFARATRRARELAVRGALGASRGRLMAQMLVESLLVAITGSILGVFLATWAVTFISTVPRSLPTWITFEINAPVLALTLAVTVATVLLSGLVPAIMASRTNSLDALKEGGRSHTSRFISRLTGGLVVGQIALTAVLLVLSLLLLKSITTRLALDFGYPLESVLAGRMNFEAVARTPDAVLSEQRRVLDQLRSSPQFAHAAFSSRRNSLLTNQSREIFRDANEQVIPVWMEMVSDGYFATLGLPLLAGREFEPSDSPNQPLVAIVNATFARKYFPGQSALGHRLALSAANGPWATIVGVAPDTLMQGPMDATRDGAGVFLPLMAIPQAYATLVVRGRAASPAQLVEPLRRELTRLHPDMAVYSVETPRDALQTMLAHLRSVTQIFGVFGIVAIVLSAAGLYGVAAFAVSQREHEFGVRLALGALPRQLMGMVLRQGAIRLASGSSVGLALAFAFARLLGANDATLLHKVSPRDPAVYALVVALLILATLLACLLPARRATRVDPMIALRAE